MEGWVARAPHEPIEMSVSCGAWPLPYLPVRRFDERDALPQSFARRRVDGGAPYLLDASAGVPQYAPDEYDTSLTYPGGCSSPPSTGIGGATTPGPDTLAAIGIAPHVSLGPSGTAQPATEGGGWPERERPPPSEPAPRRPWGQVASVIGRAAGVALPQWGLGTPSVPRTRRWTRERERRS